MRRQLLRYVGLFCVIVLFAGALWGENNQIASLWGEIERLEKKQGHLEFEKEKLVSESNELADRIEKLKKEAEKGIGVIGEYKLKKELRRSQELAQRLEALEAEIEAAQIASAEKKKGLNSLYQAEISLLLQKLNKSSPEETKLLLERVGELRAAKESLELTEERVKMEDLKVEEIDIEQEDDPEKLREKADLVSDFVDKLQGRLCLIDQKIKGLKREKKNEEKIREFVRELSLFDEDALTTRGLQVKSKDEGSLDKGYRSDDFEESSWGDFPIGEREAAKVSAERAPAPSVSGWKLSPGEIEREIEELKKEREELAQKSSDLLKKAEEFYGRAAELSKSKGTIGEP